MITARLDCGKASDGKLLQQELTTRGLVEWLEQAMRQNEAKEFEEKISNGAFHDVDARLEPQLQKITQPPGQRFAAPRASSRSSSRGSPSRPSSRPQGCCQSWLGKKAGERAACVKTEWRDVEGTAKGLGMHDDKVLR